ncbi:MAG: type III secretion system inner membrane ring subunit SctD [Plesiomonas sp.]|uniref:type III secretion system inner membrane ring subunit SctD n=1 Tax=Plesiomonas sp. TaxID=2486279 RepID=UPI003F30DFBE
MFFKIRFLNGQWLGREIILPEGIVTLGRDEACDIFLAGFVGNAITWEVKYLDDKSTIFLRGTNATNVDGVILDLALPLPTMTVIESEGIRFIVGYQHDDLSLIEKKMNTRAGVQHLKLTVITALYRFSIFSVLLVSCYLLLTFFSDKPVTRSENKKEPSFLSDAQDLSAPEKKLLNEMNVLKLNKVHAEWLTDSSVRLSGQCEKSFSIEKLHQFLIKKNIIYHDELVCQDQIINAVSMLLKQNGLSHFSVRSASKMGRIIIDGDISENKKWHIIETALDHVQGLISWQVINSSADMFNKWMQVLNEQGILNTVSVFKHENGVVITGLLTPIQEDKLNISIKNFHERFDNSLRITYQNIASDIKLQSLTASPVVSYQGNSDMAYLRLADGSRIDTGNIIAGEYKVVALDVNGIELLTSNELIHIPFYF